MMKWCVVMLVVMLTMPATQSAKAEQITIAVASNFTAAMREIVARFEQQTGHRVKVSYGSSGKLFAQVQHGAPFQAFFSADQAKPIALEKAGLVVPGSRFTYAFGGLVLWSSQPELVDEEAHVLKQGNFNKLALANPKLAPYGSAAIDVLKKMDLLEVTRGQWVQGENISQTYQFVASGNADLGFVALSQVTRQGAISEGSYWVVPAELYHPIRQDAVLLNKGKNSAATQALLRFVQGGIAAGIIKHYGYQIALL